VLAAEGEHHGAASTMGKAHQHRLLATFAAMRPGRLRAIDLANSMSREVDDNTGDLACYTTSVGVADKTP